MSLSYRRHEKIVRDAFYRKRYKETPVIREIIVYWHTGASGAGKSYSINNLYETHGEDKIYLVGEYERGFDKYNGEQILFLDELRNQLRYDQLLTILGGLKVQTYARYTNIIGLWTEVHITSVYAPEQVYRFMVNDKRHHIDTYEQLRRRISYIVHHYKQNDEYLTYEMPMDAYIDYSHMKSLISVHHSEKAAKDEGNVFETIENIDINDTPFKNDMEFVNVSLRGKETQY